MTLSLAGTRKDAGVSIAEVNLKLIWDVVSQIKVGERGHAYVVGAQGRLIAHPDISLVLRNTDMSKLVQVQAAQAGTANSDPESAAGRAQYPGPGGADGVGADRAAGLDHVRRIAGRGSLCVAVSGAAAPRHRAAGRAGLRGAGRDIPGPAHGRPDPGVARRRRAHRRRRFRPAHLDQDRRRTRRPRQPVQRHGRAAAGILRRPGEEGRAANGRIERIAGAADCDLRSAAGHQPLARRTEAGIPDHAGERDRVFATPSSACSFFTRNGGFRCTSVHNLPPAFAETFTRNPVIYPPPSDPLGRIAATQQARSRRRCQAGAGLCRPAFRRSWNCPRSRRRPDLAAGADVEGRQPCRCDCDFPARRPALHRQADRSGDELRQPGRHRHREYQAAEGIAPAYRRSERIPAAADRDRRRAQGHQPLGLRPEIRAHDADRVPRRRCAARRSASSACATAR